MGEPATTLQPAKARARAAAHPPAVLHEDAEIQVLHRPGGSDFTLVTFGDLTLRPGKGQFWARDVADRLDLDCIGVVAKRENWYPISSLDAAAPAIRAALKPRSLGYGYSMGGYGALKHGGRLGLTASFAVGPQATIAPREVPSDPRFHQFYQPYLHLGMELGQADLPPFAAVLADPFDAIDWMHAERVKAAAPGRVHLLRAPLTGHWVVWLVTGTEGFRDIAELALRHDGPGLAALLRARRHKSQSWHWLMGRAAYRSGHAATAERLWARAIELGAAPGTIAWQRIEAMDARARRLARLGRRSEGAQLAAEIRAVAPEDPAVLMRAAQLALDLGEPRHAEVLYRAALALRGTIPRAHLGLSHALMRQKRMAEAIAVAREGLERLKQEPEIACHLGQLLLAQGELDEAEAVFQGVLKRRRQHAPALLGIGQVRCQRGDFDGAFGPTRRAASTMPMNAGAAALLGRIMLGRGMRVKGERQMRRAIAMEPANPHLRLALVDALVVLGDRDGALQVLRDGLQRLPGHRLLQARLGDLDPAPAEAGVVPTGWAGWRQRLAGWLRAFSRRTGR